MLEIADRFPPFVCRFVARKDHGTKPMSHTDLAKASGLSRAYISVLSRRRSWKGIPINVVDRFSKACGVDLLTPKHTIRFLRYAKKNHLAGATIAQRKFIASLFPEKSGRNDSAPI